MLASYARWHAGGMLEHLEILGCKTSLLDLPLVEPFAASHGTTVSRRVAVVRLETSAGVGWGECAAMPSPTYTAETADGAFDLLAGEPGTSTAAAPCLGLLGIDLEPGTTLPVGPHLHHSPMAVATVEMAVLDAALNAAGQSLASYLGVTRQQVTAGAALGMMAPSDTAARTIDLVAAGYRRLKLKIAPGHDREPLAAAHDALRQLGQLGHVQLQVDANGAYDSDSIDQLVALAAEFGLTAIEQPFAVGDQASAALAIVRLDQLGLTTLVVADEAVATLDEARSVRSARAMSALSIKPGRVGGLASALALYRFCRSQQLAATAGGMVEAGLGRHMLVALSALDGFTLPGDLSPASRWIVDDPWPDLDLDAESGALAVPANVGIAPPPDEERLEAVTVRHAAFEA